MARSIFGLVTAFLCGICLICIPPAVKKRRYGLAIFCLLNAVTNLVNTIQVFWGPLF